MYVSVDRLEAAATLMLCPVRAVSNCWRALTCTPLTAIVAEYCELTITETGRSIVPVRWWAVRILLQHSVLLGARRDDMQQHARQYPQPTTGGQNRIWSCGLPVRSMG
jgi:hypothetical protein